MKFKFFWIVPLILIGTADAASKKKTASVDCSPDSGTESVVKNFDQLNKEVGRPENYLDHTSKKCLPHPEYRLNFGVVAYNDYYKFYRSTGLNEKGLKEYGKHLRKAGLEVPNKLVYLHNRNYDPLTLKGKLKKLAFRAYGKLYDESFAAKELELSEKLTKICPVDRTASCPGKYKDYFPFRFVHPRASKEEDRVDYIEAKCNPLSVGGESSCKCLTASDNCHEVSNITEAQARQSMYRALEQLLVNDGAVGFHCQGGLHRTGITALMLRYLQGGVWTQPFSKPIETKSKMKVAVNGKEFGKTVTARMTNLAEKEYFDHNPRDFREGNLLLVKDLQGDLRFKCLQEEFGPYLNAPPKRTPPSLESCFPIQAPGDRPQPEYSPEEFREKQKRELWAKCEKLGK